MPLSRERSIRQDEVRNVAHGLAVAVRAFLDHEDDCGLRPALADYDTINGADCAWCDAEAEEMRVVGADHRNTSTYDGSSASCPVCGAPWPPRGSDAG